MNERMNIKREPGELFAIEIYNDNDKLISLSYEEDLKSDIIDIIQILAKRGYIIKILYHYFSEDKD